MLCQVFSNCKCSECPFTTCNCHPQFYLAMQCAIQRDKKQPEARESSK
ncbi:MAG: hypothetical protein SWK76_06650 [Actinomycetota bacterium]|nr:hypothetical protein [Actinomycetota bacterium]